MDTEKQVVKMKGGKSTNLYLIMIGFLFMWPTLLTLAMFPILVFVYIRLAKKEENLVRAKFGSIYDDYAKDIPAFIPRFSTNSSLRTDA